MAPLAFNNRNFYKKECRNGKMSFFKDQEKTRNEKPLRTGRPQSEENIATAHSNRIERCRCAINPSEESSRPRK